MAQRGLVAFFDILGYQDIINNNLIEEVAKIISGTLSKLPDTTKGLLVDAWLPDDKAVQEHVKKTLDRLQFRVISDSVLLVCEISEENKIEELKDWVIFLSYVIALIMVSFDSGLPLRGVVDYGEFYLDSNCFAGKPIINCYRLSNSLEFSGCVLTKHCGEIFENKILDLPKVEKVKNLVGRLVMPYLAPLKGGGERLHALVWVRNKELLCNGDVRQYIVKGFQAHNKDIAPSVFTKVDNTEIMVRCFLERIAGV